MKNIVKKEIDKGDNYFLDIFSFLLAVVLAFFLKWKLGDLVWSLWLSSLVVGVLTFFVAFLRNINGSGKIAFFPSLFLFLFFMFHFGGFHAGHSAFLANFFPIENVPEQGFVDGFMNPIKLWTGVIKSLFLPYGLFLIATILTERRNIFSKDEENLQKAMGKPYKNVIRMHLLIFFFFFAKLLKLDNFIIYVVVYAVYFFPWRVLRKN